MRAHLGKSLFIDPLHLLESGNVNKFCLIQITLVFHKDMERFTVRRSQVVTRTRPCVNEERALGQTVGRNISWDTHSPIISADHRLPAGDW